MEWRILEAYMIAIAAIRIYKDILVYTYDYVTANV